MQSKIKKILCPIDFTDASTNAMEYAAKLSKELDASLTLWNMCEIPIMDEISSTNHQPNAIDRKQNELSEILQDWCEEIKEEYAVSCGYFVGTSIDNLEKTLAHYTDGGNFDLIATGTNGIDNMYQLFFGTNSYRIMREVKCPVIIIPEGYSFKKMKSVVFATDYSLDDAKFAKSVINLFEAKITFLHLSKNDNEIGQEVLNSFETLFEDEIDSHKKVSFERVVCEYKLDGLVQKMIEKEADMVIMSTKHRSWFEELFHKSFTKKVLEGIQIPALVFHHNNSGEEENRIRL
ncbi:MAG: nucleotide-binding universal stress UspA family protein [Vicingaceae bacterium]|jgi:nucleotide-binding universal stress UspA family protein